MIKKSMSVLLSLAMTLGITACGSQPAANPSKDKPAEPAKNESTSAQGFNWKQFSGQEINVMLNQHPYAEAIIQRLPEFEQKTGIKVKHSITPEENYFDKLTTALNGRNGNPDVFMTGSYQLWEYAPAEYIQELDSYLGDSNKTSPDYDVDDIYPGILNADRWDLKPGSPVGTGNLWALPLGFETNVLFYNKRAFEQAGIKEPPKTVDELIEVASKLNGWNGPGSYGIATRGTRSWATIHPGYMTLFSMHGAKDFEIENGKLVSKLDSPEAIEITEKFTELMKKGGPKDWTNYTWYQVGLDVGAGKAAIGFDADVNGFFNNVEDATKEAGNIAFAPPPLTKEGGTLGANEWVWSIAMNKSSTKKDAAWMFMQYFTSKEHMLWGATEANVVDPVRKSVWDDPKFISRMEKIDGYVDTFKAVIDNTSIKFTPQPEFFNTTTEWAAALQDIVTGNAKTEERMKKLAEDINKRVSRIRAE